VAAGGTSAITQGEILLGKYQIEAVIGSGGHGVVARARHVALGESVAIKLLREDALAPETVGHSSHTSPTPS
jgi:serine/threonine protein kinase